MNSPTILVIDDEAQIRKLLNITLQSNGYHVEEAGTAKEALLIIKSHPPDLILLDLGLPDENGHEVLRNLRTWFTNPIIIQSVQNNEEDIVKALDNGANDYLVKPFRTGELMARIRSVLRRTSSDDTNMIIDCNNLIIDLEARTVKNKTEFVKLTATEYKLLAFLAKNEGKVLTHQKLLRQVWGPSYLEESQYLRVFVAQLRKKIEENPNQPKHILTESGLGYRFLAKD